MQEPRSITISGIKYTFPRDHVDALSNENGRPYARVHAPGTDFYLEYSDYISWPNEQGVDVPTIPRLNTAPGPHNVHIEVIETSAGKVVCDRAGRYKYDCGMRYIDAGLPWSVHFNSSQVGQISALERAVAELLSSYRA